MEPINKNVFISIWLATMMIDGSAQVINAPNKKEKITMMKNFGCLDKEFPMYWPTLVSPWNVPVWNTAKPTINKNAPKNKPK